MSLNKDDDLFHLSGIPKLGPIEENIHQLQWLVDTLDIDIFVFI